MHVTVQFDPAPNWVTHAVRLETHGPTDPAVTEFLSPIRHARVLLNDPDELLAGWHFAQAVASPLSEQLTAHRLIHVSAYHPHDFAEILDFDRSINERYASYCATIGEYYAGTFHCAQLGTTWLTEIAWFDVATAQEADSLLDGQVPPQAVAEIIDECRRLQDRQAPRFSLWLEPVKS
jgi:hypothetical protein